ncbi:Na+/H+ antiporter NhaA [Candidatus Nitrotoga arctica]|uniref:Na+/H+ antiporter NhaA n=1 Tax=Candidatus Nitrotoga arctica TaxID=453162 RepID=UPI0023BACAE3|nr:Na+/H+ antiporter NhaA [Candidatus Nitrotoga arctica]
MIEEHERLIAAIVLGLVLGKPAGMVVAAALTVWSGLAVKPEAYNWRQMLGTGALTGIGFTMPLFIADRAFPRRRGFYRRQDRRVPRLATRRVIGSSNPVAASGRTKGVYFMYDRGTERLCGRQRRHRQSAEGGTKITVLPRSQGVPWP